MKTITIRNFDLQSICESGQVFRMYMRRPGLFDVYSGARHLRIGQEGELVTFYCSSAEYEGYWKHYFDLDRDYGRLVSMIEDDRDAPAFVRDACTFGKGIRVLNQDVWEMMISFIISQQKQIPSIRKCIEALCMRFGEPRVDDDGRWFTFPTAKAIVAGGPDGLKGLSLGYREGYIYETAERYLRKGLKDEKLKRLGLEEAREYLMEFKGIGEKVANCICLFAGEYSDSFPIDVHVKDILYREYYHGSAAQESLTMAEYNELAEANLGKYSPFRGIVQQWMFAYELYTVNKS